MTISFGCAFVVLLFDFVCEINGSTIVVETWFELRLRAVLSVMPLDTFDPNPALSMQVVGDPAKVPPAVADFQGLIDAVADNPAAIHPLERFAFYDRAAEAFAIVQTGDTRLYANIILKKGVIGS